VFVLQTLLLLRHSEYKASAPGLYVKEKEVLLV
jgi:hypothetical protein